MGQGKTGKRPYLGQHPVSVEGRVRSDALCVFTARIFDHSASLFLEEEEEESRHLRDEVVHDPSRHRGVEVDVGHDMGIRGGWGENVQHEFELLDDEFIMKPSDGFPRYVYCFA